MSTAYNYDCPRLLRVRQIVAPDGLLPISRSTWYDWVAKGYVNKGRKLSAGVTVWDIRDLSHLLTVASNEA